jgi:hypothetical protein
MPPRHTYWTIILDGKPTAFRTHTQEELLPTLRQLQTRHPDAVMLWFARGRLWQSPEHARLAMVARRSQGERRGPAWRPGGSHRDPRERFKVPRDEKRRRFANRLRGTRPPQGPAGSGPRVPESRPRGDRPPSKSSRPAPQGERGARGWSGDRRPGGPNRGWQRGRKPGGGGRKGGAGGGSPR